MNTKEIERLIARYEEGETTLAEERQLREFFAGEQVPGELAVYRHLFSFYRAEQKEEIINPEFDRMLSEKLVEREGKVVTMIPRRTRIAYIASIAAAAVILAGIAVTLILNPRTGSSYSKADELAYAEAQEALEIVSSNLNCGVSQVRYLQALDKGMEQVQMLSKFYEYQSIIINPDEVQAPSDKNHN